MVFPLTSFTTRLPIQTLVLDGTEQTMFTSSGPNHELEAYIDLSQILATDSVNIKTYIRQGVGELYVLHGNVPYPNPTTLDVSKPMMHYRELPGAYALKVTIQQTAGAFRTIKYSVIETRLP
jgi:hypothetical protein